MAIIGWDDRWLVENATDRLPYSALVQVYSFYLDAGVYHQGSGVLVGPNDVLTAAHVIYDTSLGDYADFVLVSPGRNGEVKPFGTVYGDDLRIPQGWAFYEDFAYDYGIIGLNRPIGYNTGWHELGWVNDPAALIGEAMQSFGYPSDLGGDILVGTWGTVDTIVNSVVFFVDDLDAWYGQSGSPVFETFGEGTSPVIGVVSFHSLFPTYNGVVTWNPTIYETLNAWMETNDQGWEPPRWESIYTKDEVGRVAGLYHTLLGRDPDEGGLRYWVDAVHQGLPLTQVVQAFLASDEYRTDPSLDASSPEAWVTVLYQELLQREPDHGGFAYWVGRIEVGLSLEEAAARFVFSEEFADRWALKAYEAWHTHFEDFSLASFGIWEDEVLLGTEGDDYFNAGYGNDWIEGKDGDDYLNGGPGDDVLMGGPGRDFFVFIPDEGGQDIALDFDPREDFLRIRGESTAYSFLETAEGLRVEGETGASLLLLGVTAEKASDIWVFV